MPTEKNTKIKSKEKVNKKDILEGEAIVEIDEPDTEEVQPDEELDPEVIEALKIKKNKPKKNSSETDYIPELERGEFDFEPGGDEDY